MTDAIAVLFMFVFTIVLALNSTDCLNSESVSISTEESQTQIETRDESVSTAFSSIGTQTRSLMANRSKSKPETVEYGMMMPLSTNSSNAYPVEFIDPYDSYYEYMDKLAEEEILEIDESEIPTTNFVTFDPYDISLSNITGASSDDWDEFIDELCNERGYDSNHFLRGKGNVLSKLEDDFNINPIGLISIWVWESDIGSSYIGRNNHNLAGIRGSNGYKYFDTYTDCMVYHARLLRENYLDDGLYTWEMIGDKYCPDNDEWPVVIESTVYEYNELLYKIMTR